MRPLNTPILSALQKYIDNDIVRFHMPGHKGKPGLENIMENMLGSRLFAADVTNVPGMDDLHQPAEVIEEAQNLAAKAFGADKTYFLINGSSCGLQALIMAACNPDDTILVPRNIHRSILSGMIFSGAIPVFYLPEYSPRFGIPAGVQPATIEQALRKHPSTKAVLIVHPTYHGIASDLSAISQITHDHGAVLLIDEAHGPHLPFHDHLPASSLELGADGVVHGTHKMLTSLTQSSMLHLKGSRMSRVRLEAALRLVQSTSTSYLLLASLDAARAQMEQYGYQLIHSALEDSLYFRQEIQKAYPLEILGTDCVGSLGIYDLDLCKIVISFKQLGLSGFEAERLLRNSYNLQVELSDLYNILILLTFGNTRSHIQQLLTALEYLVQNMKRPSFAEKKYGSLETSLIMPSVPELVISPRQAFFSHSTPVPLEASAGRICAEIISCYPPGIPALGPGEKITKDSIDYIRLMRSFGAHFQGCKDNTLQYVYVIDA